MWIAPCDARRLKPRREVKAPVGAGESVMSRGKGCFTGGDLLHPFNLVQDRGLTAQGTLVVDETGLPDGLGLTFQNPDWSGERAFEIVREWFELGITFHEQVRRMTVHVVRRNEAR